MIANENEEKAVCDRCGATATTTVRSWVGTMHDQCAGCATQTRAEAEAEVSPPMPGLGVPPRCGACHPQDGANPDHHTNSAGCRQVFRG